jgi:hypothetical protein
MIKCTRDKVELGVNEDDLELIYSTIPAEVIQKAKSEGVLDKTVASTIYVSDLRHIFKSLIDDLGSEGAVAVISLAISHVVDEIK